MKNWISKLFWWLVKVIQLVKRKKVKNKNSGIVTLVKYSIPGDLTRKQTSVLVPVMGITKLINIIPVPILMVKIVISVEHSNDHHDSDQAEFC